MASSVFQIVIGFSGVIGFLMRYIGPITVAPTVTLIGLALFHVAGDHAGERYNKPVICISLILYYINVSSNIPLKIATADNRRHSI
jgi:nucleobase transporter 1/2